MKYFLFLCCFFVFLTNSFCYFKTDRIILKLKKSSTISALNNKIQSSGIKDISKLNVDFQSRDDLFVLKLDSFKTKEEIENIISKLSKEIDAQYIEPDYIFKPAFTPNDTYYSYQWHFYDITGGINLPSAWDIFRGTDSVVVAVLDTGILAHSDLDSSRILPGYDMISSTFVANDGDLRDPDPSDPGDWCSAFERNNNWQGNLCYDSGCASNCPAINSSWHGLHVTGTIAEKTNNSLYGSGIDWYSKILPVRVLGKGGGYMSDVADGIIWAAGGSVSGLPQNQNPAKIINLSLSANASCEYTLQNAINFAVSQGAVVVVAAGNNSSSVYNFSPANCNNVITVAAVDRFGNLASYSNYGDLVFISAPGGNSINYVYSLWNNGVTTPSSDSFAGMSGTSMAAPHVAGVISLMKGFKPSLTVNEIRYNLKKTAKPFPYGSTCNYSICGAGIVDAYSALNNLIISITSTTPNSAINNGSLNISIWGKGFLQGATVKLKKTGSPDIICGNVNVVNLNQINCSANLSNVSPGQWSVEVVNADQSSHTLTSYFTVYNFQVSNLSPTSAYNSNSNLLLTLSGTGFTYPMSIRLTKTGYSDILCSNVNVVNQNTATCVLNLLGEFSGKRDVFILNGDGKNQTIVDGFEILNTTPSLSYISPNSAYNDSQVLINIYGSGFYKNSTAKITRSGEPDLNCNINVYSSTYALCNVNLYGSFDGLKDFVFNNSGNILTILNGFNVLNTTIYINVVNPPSAFNNSSVNLSVYGKGFSKTTSIKLSKTGYEDISPNLFQVYSSTYLVANFNLLNTPAGKRNVVVYYGSISYTKNDAFTIVDSLSSPYIYRIEPSSDFNNKNPVINIYGENFIAGAYLYIFNDVEIKQIVDFNLTSSTSIIGAVLPIKGYPQGKWSIKIKNPDNKESVLLDCFTLVEFKEEARVYEGVIKPGSLTKAKIVYNLDNQDKVRITVYDNMGKKIREIYNGMSSSGLNEIEWDGKQENGSFVKSGVYLIEIETSKYKIYKRVLVIR